MKTLALRIFVGFWLAMVAVAAVLVVSSPFFTRSRPRIERWERGAEQALGERLARVAARIAAGEAEPLPTEHHRDRPGPPLFVLTPEGAAVEGPPPPDDVAAFARRVAAAGERVSERAGAVHLVGLPVTGPDGVTSILVAAARRPPTLVDLLEPRALGLPLAALTLAAGVLCFWLARTLTAPVTALRGTVRRLADGDLGARVTPAVGRRRDEIGDLGRDFDAMAGRLEALLAAQQRLVRDVSHELRSPLARLRVALELARQGSGDSARRALDRIEDEADRLNDMIEQLLTLSRLEAGSRDVERVRFDAAGVVAEVVDDASFEAAARDCTVRLDVAGPCELVGSPALLRSAVENVLRNAVLYTAANSEIEVALAIGGSADARRAAIRVRDHGPGVPEELLRDVFRPFFRVDDDRARATGGSGLGLAIAARAVELHGGTIAASNAPAGGLEVTISLPLPPG